MLLHATFLQKFSCQHSQGDHKVWAEQQGYGSGWLVEVKWSWLGSLAGRVSRKNLSLSQRNMPASHWEEKMSPEIYSPVTNPCENLKNNPPIWHFCSLSLLQWLKFGLYLDARKEVTIYCIYINKIKGGKKSSYFPWTNSLVFPLQSLCSLFNI